MNQKRLQLKLKEVIKRASIKSVTTVKELNYRVDINTLRMV